MRQSLDAEVDSSTVRIVRCSGRALHFGVQQPQTAGGRIRVFSTAKTVTDIGKKIDY